MENIAQKSAQLNNLFQKRYSVREYSDKSVDNKDLLACVEAAGLAPSSINSQPWKFVIVKDNITRSHIAEMVIYPPESNPLKHNAPVFVAIVQELPDIDITERRHVGEHFIDIDHGLAAGHFCLKATELGLGTCIIGAFNEQTLKQELSIPKNKKVKLIIAVGYPESGDLFETAPDKSRKNSDEIVCFERYQ